MASNLGLKRQMQKENKIAYRMFRRPFRLSSELLTSSIRDSSHIKSSFVELSNPYDANIIGFNVANLRASKKPSNETEIYLPGEGIRPDGPAFCCMALLRSSGGTSSRSNVPD